MLQIIAAVLLVCLAIWTSGEIQRERAVFDAEHQTTLVKLFVWLYPLPFVLPLVHRSFWLLFFPVPLGAAFFIPAMAVAVANQRCFDRSGHPRAKSAANAVAHVITCGIMGLMGMALLTGTLWLQWRRTGLR